MRERERRERDLGWEHATWYHGKTFLKPKCKVHDRICGLYVAAAAAAAAAVEEDGSWGCNARCV